MLILEIRRLSSEYGGLETKRAIQGRDVGRTNWQRYHHKKEKNIPCACPLKGEEVSPASSRGA